jgi:TolA-binding protein
MEWTNRLLQMGQKDQAVQVLEMIPQFDPLAQEANHAYLRIAEIHAQDLANPLKAVEPYLMYVNRGNPDTDVRNRLFTMAGELAGRNRYLESLHLYRVFVESFPTDPRLAAALHAMGQLFQTNEAWASAILVYQRVLKEHPADPVVAQVQRALAQCHIHLGDWQQARFAYQQELAARPQAPDAAQLRSRSEVLEQIQRYAELLADREDRPNKADAQFQIGRLVWDKLDNPARAILEFQKVPEKYPGNSLADDAQLEVGRALLALDRAAEARKALLEVPTRYSGSPLADDALFLLGQSYEKEAQKLSTLTVDVVRAEAQRARQQDAFLKFTRQEEVQAKKDLASPMILGQPEADVLTSTLQGSLASTSADQLFCHVCEAEARAESESVLRVASRQDRINEAHREAVAMYLRAATDYPLGDSTDTSLSRMAHIFENELKDQARAVQTYEQIVKLFPGTPLAEDAAWKLANFFVASRQYEKAAEAYHDFIRNYPASGRVADAQFGQADMLQRVEKWVEAMDAYEVFRQKFPQHPQAAKALEQINWIKTYRRK